MVVGIVPVVLCVPVGRVPPVVRCVPVGRVPPVRIVPVLIGLLFSVPAATTNDRLDNPACKRHQVKEFHVLAVPTGMPEAYNYIMKEHGFAHTRREEFDMTGQELPMSHCCSVC